MKDVKKTEQEEQDQEAGVKIIYSGMVLGAQNIHIRSNDVL